MAFGSTPAPGTKHQPFLSCGLEQVLVYSGIEMEKIILMWNTRCTKELSGDFIQAMVVGRTFINEKLRGFMKATKSESHGKRYGTHRGRVELGPIWDYETAGSSFIGSHCWEHQRVGDFITRAVFPRAQGSGKFNIVTYYRYLRAIKSITMWGACYRTHAPRHG